MVLITRIVDDGAGGVAIIFDTAAPDTVLREIVAAVSTYGTTPGAAIKAFMPRSVVALSTSEQGKVLMVPRSSLGQDWLNLAMFCD